MIEKGLILNELQIPLKQLKGNKSTGTDGITNEMLPHIGCFTSHTLLDIYNLSWTEDRLPQSWRGSHDSHT